MSDGVLAAAAARLLDRAVEALGAGQRGIVVESCLCELSDADALEIMRAWGATRRLALIGDGSLFIGGGVALDHGPRSAAEAAAILAAHQQHDHHRERRYGLALPFSTASHLGDASWSRLRRTSLWAPRVFIQRTERGTLVLGADLAGDDDIRATFAQLQELLAGVGSKPSAIPRGEVVRSQLGSWQQQPNRQRHAQAVRRAIATMLDGALTKVVLGRRTRLSLAGRMRLGELARLACMLLEQIEISSARETKWMVGEGDDVVVGCTPERLVRRRGKEVAIDVLAGTARRGEDAILSCDKERREHEAVRSFVIDALRQEEASIDAPSAPTLRRLHFIQHLWTPVSASLPTSRPVFHRLHPTPAVAGVPTPRAALLIDELEGFDRGLYAGAIGVACADAEDVWVGLRCAHLHAGAAGEGGLIDVYAGGGLVLGSDPDAEWRELDDKARTILGALERLGIHPREARGAA